MLQCGANFERSYGGKFCKDCGVVDDESHRINYCRNYETVNLYNCTERLNCELIYTEDRCMQVVERVLIMWDLVNGKNRMRE